MKRTSSRPFRALLVNFGISLAVACLVLLLTQDTLLNLPPFRRAELSLIDLRFEIRGPRPAIVDSSDVIIVGIVHRLTNTIRKSDKNVTRQQLDPGLRIQGVSQQSNDGSALTES